MHGVQDAHLTVIFTTIHSLYVLHTLYMSGHNRLILYCIYQTHAHLLSTVVHLFDFFDPTTNILLQGIEEGSVCD